MALRIISVSQKVYQLVKTIPQGKVATYGQIASLIQKSKFKSQNYSLKLKVSPRVVGWILHQNKQSLQSSSLDELGTAGLKDSKVPCHRVVDRNGQIAKSFAFGGWREQRKRLIAEGVKFKDKMHVDLDSCRWQG